MLMPANLNIYFLNTFFIGKLINLNNLPTISLDYDNTLYKNVEKNY